MPSSNCRRCIAKKTDGTQCKNNTCRQYPYCWIHLKSIDKLQVKQSTIPNANKGLFYVGKEPIRPHKKITEYSAETISTQPNPNSNYVLQVSKDKYLDAENPLNFVGRYINDKRNTNKTANTRFTRGTRIYDKHDRKYVPIYTSRTIKPNEELLINYGRRFNI